MIYSDAAILFNSPHISLYCCCSRVLMLFICFFNGCYKLIWPSKCCAADIIQCLLQLKTDVLFPASSFLVTTKDVPTGAKTVKTQIYSKLLKNPSDQNISLNWVRCYCLNRDDSDRFVPFPHFFPYCLHLFKGNIANQR